MPEIKTFVFFDIEATGLSEPIEITELAMIAVSREDLLKAKENGSFPRIMQKFVIHMKPRKEIEGQAARISGKIKTKIVFIFTSAILFNNNLSEKSFQ